MFRSVDLRQLIFLHQLTKVHRPKRPVLISISCYVKLNEKFQVISHSNEPIQYNNYTRYVHVDSGGENISGELLT